MASSVALDAEADQRNTYSATDRILRWIRTGKHTFKTDYVGSEASGSTIRTEQIQDGSVEKASSALSIHTIKTSSNSSQSDLSEESVDLNPDPKPIALLVGCQDDPLIPSPDQINYTFLKGQNIWGAYVTHAKSLPSGCIPVRSLDPYVLLQHTPPLPQDLPKKRSITGQAIWDVPSPEFSKSWELLEHTDEGDWNPEFVHGIKKTFPLSISKPIECRISTRSDFRLDDEEPNGVAILMALWSYIFCVRFLEMQRRRMRYSTTRLSPVLKQDVKPRPRDIVLYFGCASRDLVRWLCAVLAPGLGWQVTGPLPPWAAHYLKDAHFIIVTDKPFEFLVHEQPPSSQKAADLLAEFCALYGFGSPVEDNRKPFEKFQQPTLAFLAALALPFYHHLELQPQLPMPRITIDHRMHAIPPECIRDYVNDLPYYMTLCLHPATAGSVIWSIFWEPGLECNLVSAWFGAILEVLQPIIEAGDLEMLAKIFIVRRLQPALLWLGVLVMCDLAMLDMLVSYLESHQERENFGSWSGPDIDVAVWTGSKQSFLDENVSDTYGGTAAQVPRSDLLRHRFNFRLGDPDILRFGWQPPGHVPKQQIEPELWPRLEVGCSRKYKHWIWWLPDRDGKGVLKIPEIMIPDIRQGFRHDKIRYRQSATNEPNLETGTVAVPDGFSCKVGLGPSRDATFHVVSYGSKDAAGDRSLEAMAIPGVRQHPWMADSRGI